MPGSQPRRGFLAGSFAVISSALIGSRIGGPLVAQEPNPTERLRALGITLPPLSTAIGTYVPAVQVGNLLFVSGHGPALLPDGTRLAGKVGRDLTLDQGKAAARRVGLNVLASVQSGARKPRPR